MDDTGSLNEGKQSFARIVLVSLIEIGWSVEQFGQLYGMAVKNKKYTKERIYQMIRKDAFPQDPKRRWIIAKLLQIPPMYLGLSTLDRLLPPPPPLLQGVNSPVIALRNGKVDIDEFERSLLTIEKQYTRNTDIASLKEIRVRIRYLHDEALYRSNEDGRKIRQLVCGYQIAAGNILRDLFRVNDAVKHLNKAVALARENNYTELYVTALMHRGILF